LKKLARQSRNQSGKRYFTAEALSSPSSEHFSIKIALLCALCASAVSSLCGRYKRMATGNFAQPTESLNYSNTKGFLVLEMLVAGMILTASIAAAMYLFRIGAQNLERVENSNLISAKLPQVMSLLRGLDLAKPGGVETLGDGVVLRWESALVDHVVPGQPEAKGARLAQEIGLYRVDFSVEYENRLKREYSIHVFRFKSSGSPSEALSLF
jgi:hypothetical protein